MKTEFDFHRLIIILTLTIFLSLSTYSEILVPANNTRINYYGRFDLSTPPVAKFNWSGSAIEATFSGPSIGISLTDGQNDYDIEIDSEHYMVLKTVSSTTKYAIAENLSGTSHTIRIVQRSENHWNTATFGGFYLADNNQLLTAPQKAIRKIEFIGDSWTVGYGNESTSRSCSNLRTYTNTNRSFPRLISDSLHAQSIILGWSGIGMVRNFGESSKKSNAPFSFYYNRTFGAIDGFWDFSKWIPDLVVICLGINDFSTNPNPDDTMYCNAYHNFIKTIRTNYPNSSIFCVSAHAGPMDTYVKKVVHDEKSTFGRSNIYYSETPSSLTLNGCDWHPTVSDDSLIAKVLAKNIADSLGWDTKTALRIQDKMLKANISTIKAEFNRNEILFSIPSHLQSTELNIVNLSGSIIQCAKISRDNKFTWNTSKIPAGAYIVYCKDINSSKKIIIKK